MDKNLWKISEASSILISPFKSSTLMLNSLKKRFTKKNENMTRDRSYSENDLISEEKFLTKVSSTSSISTASTSSNRSNEVSQEREII
jgi:hypothetical protein